ncbi:MAG: DUF5522 domain-containing protein [Bryobacteraceae bacterium]
MTPDNENDLPATVADFDADGALTREFLLRRGSCCENGCRNCPYGFVLPNESKKDDTSQS